MLIKYKEKKMSKNVTLKHFVEDILPTIYVDRSFQRKACWSDDSCRSFIVSANKNHAPYPIVVSDVKSGIKKSQQVHDKNSEEQYTKASLQNFNYISLDGQNRAVALKRLLNNQITLSGDFIDADGKQVRVSNKFYRDLPDRLRDALRDIRIELNSIDGVLYSELHEVFININSGEALSRQEKRNAFSTPISSFIRETSEDTLFSSMYLRISGQDERKVLRSMDAEWLLKAYLACLPETKSNNYFKGFGKPDIMDEFYLLGTPNRCGNYTPEQYSESHKNRFMKILTLIDQITSEVSIIPAKMWWLSLYVAEYLIDNNIFVSDYGKLYKVMKNIDKTLQDNSRKTHSSDIEKWEKQGKQISQEPSKTDYYFWWTSQPGDMKRVQKRKKAFFKKLIRNKKFLELNKQQLQLQL
tara:strand:- start:252 stop:1487 length:1236 start_codon:yes stop_codon:yes gene_type:complete